jgi:hypothetical protein
VSGAERVIRWSTALAVVGVAAVAAVVSYEHASAVVRGTWRVRLDRAPDPADSGRPHLLKFDGDA